MSRLADICIKTVKVKAWMNNNFTFSLLPHTISHNILITSVYILAPRIAYSLFRHRRTPLYYTIAHSLFLFPILSLSLLTGITYNLSVVSLSPLINQRYFRPDVQIYPRRLSVFHPPIPCWKLKFVLEIVFSRKRAGLGRMGSVSICKFTACLFDRTGV